VPVYAWSIQQAPTGTISILANGNPAPGTISYDPRNGSFTGNYSSASFQWAYLAGSLNLSIATPGNYTFTASYSGDQYYLASQSPYSLLVQVRDTTFNIASPISNVTITAPGQSGTASVTLVGTDNFFGPINVSCTLPAAMTEATCPPVTANMGSSSNTVSAPLTITTTAPHQVNADRRASVGLYGFGVLAGVFLFTIPCANRGMRRKGLPLALLLFSGVVFIASCGSGSSSPPPQMDPGTPAGTYTVSVTATSSGITRTGSFNVTVQ
jgi:hypothetical protein